MIKLLNVTQQERSKNSSKILYYKLGNKIRFPNNKNINKIFRIFREEKLDFDTYMNYLNDLAKSKDVDLSEIQAKLSNTNTKILTVCILLFFMLHFIVPVLICLSFQ